MHNTNAEKNTILTCLSCHVYHILVILSLSIWSLTPYLLFFRSPFIVCVCAHQTMHIFVWWRSACLPACRDRTLLRSFQYIISIDRLHIILFASSHLPLENQFARAEEKKWNVLINRSLKNYSTHQNQMNNRNWNKFRTFAASMVLLWRWPINQCCCFTQFIQRIWNMKMGCARIKQKRNNKINDKWRRNRSS